MHYNWNKLYAQQWDKYTFPSLWYCLFALWCLMPISTISQLYRGGQFYWRRKAWENHRPVASGWQTLTHNVAHLALIEIRTHIIGDRYWLHRLVVNPTTIRSQPRLPPVTFWFCFTIYVISLHYIILLL
jgi:hypothetical protein